MFEVKATAGDTHLGGVDFDKKMFNHFVQEFKRKYHKDLTTNKRAVIKLLTACEQAKHMLSSATVANIDIDSLFDGIDFNTTITRARFEELNEQLFYSTLRLVDKCLRDARMDRKGINDIVLVGGSTRIPKVRELLQNYFDGKELNKSINADEAVAYGAAVHAANLAGDTSKQIKDLLVLEMTALSLGIELYGGVMDVIIERNTSIPAKYTKIYTTRKTNQTVVPFAVYQGERKLVKDNFLLGVFKLSGIPPAPAGVPKFDVTFDINANGILNVTAVDKSGGIKNNINIAIDNGRLNDQEIDRLVKEAKYHRASDEKEKRRVSALNNLESYCLNMMSAVKEGKLKGLSQAEKDTILDKCNKALRWLNDNRRAEKEMFQRKQKELDSVCKPIMTKM
jgi:L1 cell adhesion molecule like protein